jgi:uncharacterized protein (TIGR03083 family)
MIDLAAAYEETHDHLVEIVLALDDSALKTVVPASPAWSVKDVVAHVTGIAGDVAHGLTPPDLDVLEAWRNPEQAAKRDTMTAKQVDERRDRTLDQILEEWSGHIERLLPMLRGEVPFGTSLPFVGHVVNTDLAVHSQDVRGAVRVPGDRDSAGVGIGLAGYSFGLDLRIRALGLPALTLRYGEKERILGDGEPAATLEAERFEIFRALSGRRSRDQILAMKWTGDPEPYLALIPAYGERSDPITE